MSAEWVDVGNDTYERRIGDAKAVARRLPWLEERPWRAEVYRGSRSPAWTEANETLLAAKSSATRKAKALYGGDEEAV